MTGVAEKESPTLWSEQQGNGGLHDGMNEESFTFILINAWKLAHEQMASPVKQRNGRTVGHPLINIPEELRHIIICNRFCELEWGFAVIVSSPWVGSSSQQQFNQITTAS
jgi:hypothetical protein